MSFSIKKTVYLLSAVIILSGCTQNIFQAFTTKDISVKEKFYESSQNYRGLISLYRESLKEKENPEIRYKLSESYYKIGDSKSSMLYLLPLFSDKKAEANLQNIYLLKIKNTLHQGNYQQAIDDAKIMLEKYPDNGEGYNLLGIAYAKLHNYKQARESFENARKYFIDDVKVLNNLAMIEILQNNYQSAIDILLPQYINGIKESRLIHNLVFALVMKGNKKYALDILEKENLTTKPELLIEELQKSKHALK
ncbi:tetratricopeptide repeat protein [Avibacterium paragallinarum]|uniref:tetratricopeptide repeat protein n=1 Tax=Avibacterium paragallinarum TaxID=728 RepID=UPI00397A3504